MITTIVHTDLTNKQVDEAIHLYAPIGLEVEGLLSRRHLEYGVVLAISAERLRGKREMYAPKFQVFLTKRREVISFEPEATMATGIEEACRYSFASIDGLTLYPVNVDKRKMSPREVVDTIVDCLVAQIKK